MYQQQPPPESLHNGMTVELNIGFGWIHFSADNGGSSASDTSDLALGGLDLGIGGWVSPHLAITGRFAGVTYSESQGGATGRLTDGFVGPVAQYWIDNHLWFGGGIGLGFLAVSYNDGSSSDSDSTSGLSFDLRGGYTFNEGTENTFNVSLELNPGFYSENGSSATYTGIALLHGYQHL
jgi:hypothetical protein